MIAKIKEAIQKAKNGECVVRIQYGNDFSKDCAIVDSSKDVEFLEGAILVNYPEIGEVIPYSAIQVIQITYLSEEEIVEKMTKKMEENSIDPIDILKRMMNDY